MSAAPPQPHAPSYYEASRNRSLTFASLTGHEHADVCVVGGGFTGLNTALELAERGLTVILLEARRVGWGASGRNGGQLIRGLGHDLDRFIPLLGAEGVRELKRLGLEAVQLVRQRIERHAIDCDLTWGYCDLANKPRHMDDFLAAREELLDLGYPHELRLLGAGELQEVIDSERYVGGMIDMGSGHLHPLNLALGEAEAAARAGVRLFEQSPVTRLEYGRRVRVHTAQGQVETDTLVLACNAYLGRLDPTLGGKVLPAGSYIIATEPLGEERARALIRDNEAVANTNFIVDYYRLTGDSRMLFGGRASYSTLEPPNLGAYMRPRMLKVFPQLRDVKVDYAWGGYIAITANRIPDCGRLGPAVYYAHGYSGQGVALAGVYGKLMAEAIRGQAERFDLLARIRHMPFPGGPVRTPMLVAAMMYYRIRDALS